MKYSFYAGRYQDCKSLGKTLQDVVDPEHLPKKCGADSDVYAGVVEVRREVSLVEAVFGLAEAVFHDDV